MPLGKMEGAMRLGELMATNNSKTLVQVVLVTEKRIESESGVWALVAIAFPEQLVPVTATSFKLRDQCSCLQLTYDQWLKPDAEKAIRSWAKIAAKRVRDLPPRGDEKLSEDIKSDHGILPYFLLNLLEKIDPMYATSPSYTRKWNVIDGPQVKEGLFSKPRPSKILAIGVYSE